MKKFIVQHAGKNVFVEISPCSWMYPGYGLQISMSMNENSCNAASVFSNDKSINVASLSNEEMTEQARAQAFTWLEINGISPLAVAISDHKRISAEFAKKMEKSNVAQKASEQKKFKKMQLKGYTHRFLAYIHPSDGEDYQIEAFTQGSPTPKDIGKLLAKSEVKDNFNIASLASLLGEIPEPVIAV